MIAFHYPPFSGSSGSRRTLAFSRYLPEHGWQPTVLTVHPRAYDVSDERELAQLPPGVDVVRAFSFDAARDFSLLGRYPAAMAVPDRWRSWGWFAERAAERIVRERRPDVIWSTYPIATAHAIAARLVARHRIPWVADMRDPMVELDPYTGVEYPRDPAVRRARLDIERVVARDAQRIVFCTGGAQRICVERYGAEVAERCSLIENGYDESAFADAERDLDVTRRPATGSFRLIHSGTVYPGDDRGPGPLFRALAVLREERGLPGGFRLVLRSTGYDRQTAELARAEGVDDLVEIQPALPYREALREMMMADGLLLLQGAASNPAIPAKLYEYMRAGRPILGLVHPDGESAALLRRLDAAVTAPLDAVAGIAAALRTFFGQCIAGQARVVGRDAARQFSRQAQSARLSALLTAVTRAPGATARVKQVT